MKRFLYNLQWRALLALAHFGRQAWRADNPADRMQQILLAEHYRQLVRRGEPMPSFADAEFSAFSQNGEDGILLMLFAAIGWGNRRVVEACAGDGIECNSANLIINHGCEALLLDGDAGKIERGKAFYRRYTNAWRLRRLPPTLVQAWLDCESINPLLERHGMSGEIDLLTIDLDGIDYWLWKAIDRINPRVVIVEYNNRFPAELAVTVPYSRDFVGTGASADGEGYFGASLAAFKKLGAEKGYRLIGANSPNTNAFFMRNDVGNAQFPEVSVASCLTSDYARHQHASKYPLIKDRPVVAV